MKIPILVIALILLACGSVLLLLLGWVLFASGSQWFFGSRGTIKAKRSQKRIDEIDKLIDAGNFHRALEELRKAAWIDIPATRQLISAAREHNQNILSRALVVSEELGGRAENIAQVERLFMELAELQLLYLKSSEAFIKLKARRTQAGKELPTWGRADYDTRLNEVKKELARTSSELRNALDKLFSAIEAPAPSNVTYH